MNGDLAFVTVTHAMAVSLCFLAGALTLIAVLWATRRHS